MRRALSALSVLAIALALAVPATAATPSPARMAAQIRTLQKQVKTLQKQVKTLRSNVNTAAGLALIALTYGACSTAVTADALQASQPGQFGTTRVSDPSPVSNNGTACGDLSEAANKPISRQNTTPTTSVFQQLLNIFA
jgi:hypothetical protein